MSMDEERNTQAAEELAEGGSGRSRCTAIIVAAGSGRRMGGPVSKQYLALGGEPILAHTIRAFQESAWIDDIVVVVGFHEVTSVWMNLIEAYRFDKVSQVVAGGAERYESVYIGLTACDDTDFVFIHDGVRPFVTEELLARGYQTAALYGNAICGVPTKDTVKIADESGTVLTTPPRSHVWSVQTPQIFRYRDILAAYDRLAAEASDHAAVTDDAMVLETMTDQKVHMFLGDYRNIKITTPEDLDIAQAFLRSSK